MIRRKIFTQVALEVSQNPQLEAGGDDDSGEESIPSDAPPTYFLEARHSQQIQGGRRHGSTAHYSVAGSSKTRMSTLSSVTVDSTDPPSPQRFRSRSRSLSRPRPDPEVEHPPFPDLPRDMGYWHNSTRPTAPDAGMIRIQTSGLMPLPVDRRGGYPESPNTLAMGMPSPAYTEVATPVRSPPSASARRRPLPPVPPLRQS